MCMQDILIGRKAAVRVQLATISTLGGLNLPADPRRIAVHMAQAVASGVSVCIRQESPTGIPLAFADQFPGAVSMHIETHGQAVTGPLSFTTNAGGGVSCGITEVYLPDDDLPKEYYRGH